MTNLLRERLTRATDRLVAVLLLLLLAGTAAIALAPGLFTDRIPYGPEDLGSVATGTLKASRDYDILDEETTRRKREEAVAAVRAVYVHDPAALADAVRRIRDGFAAGRAAIARAEQAGDGQALAAAQPEIERAFGVQFEQQDLAQLAAARFSTEAEEAVVAVVAAAMREMVVGDREELAQHRERGIAILRRAGPDRLVEESLSDVSGIRDLARVRDAIGPDSIDLAGASPQLRGALAQLARREVRVNLEFEPDLTRRRREEAARSVKPVIIQLKKGEKIVGDGERIEERHLVILQGMRMQAEGGDSIQGYLGGGLLALLLVLVLVGFAGRGLWKRVERRDLVFLATALVASILLTDIWVAAADVLRERTPEIPPQAWSYAIPFAATVMLVRVVLPASQALLTAVPLAIFGGVLTGNAIEVVGLALAGSLAGSANVATARDRWAIFRSGIWAGLAQAGVVVAHALLAGRVTSWDSLLDAVAALLGGALFSPVLVISLLPLVERIFGYTTDIRLLELASLNHPALKELIVRAPGTYHHSIIVGSLVEAAAEAIGANPLLARVCAYYHDIGKGKDPLYFSENQKGTNPHDELPPEESARRIIAHVPIGLELARKYDLPRAVADAIPQHHGTRLVGYFFHKAVKQREGKADAAPVDPELFRYPGPRPQSREAALIMMADAVEAASRAMPDPTPEKLRALVEKLIHGIFADGQLDECDLSLRDLSKITESFCHTLDGIYHARPDYPAAAKGPQSQLEAENVKPPAREAAG